MSWNVSKGLAKPVATVGKGALVLTHDVSKLGFELTKDTSKIALDLGKEAVKYTVNNPAPAIAVVATTYVLDKKYDFRKKRLHVT